MTPRLITLHVDELAHKAALATYNHPESKFPSLPGRRADITAAMYELLLRVGALKHVPIAEESHDA